MADKVPVGATIARAYRFAFGNIVDNLGAIWIPVVLLWIAAYFFLTPYTRAVAQLVSGGPPGFQGWMPVVLGAFVLMFALVTAQIAALTKEALGLRTGSAFLQFPFGAPAWRLLFTYLLFVLAMVAIYIV